jgi:hypothetical protein
VARAWRARARRRGAAGGARRDQRAEAWEPALTAILPGAPGAVVDRTDARGARLASFERGHPVFAPFAEAHAGDLTGAAPAAAPRDAAGPRRPRAGARRRRRAGAGRARRGQRPRGRLGVDDGRLWTDLALQPVFVPLVHQLALHAARHAPAPAAHVVGRA